MKDIYEIHVIGCDDSTYVEMGLDEEEFAVVQRLAELVTETSSYGCEPTMSVSLLKVGDE